jgi:hypothetical protein
MMPLHPFTRRVLSCVAALCAAWSLAATARAADLSAGRKQVCAYTQNQTQLLPGFASLVGRATVDCGMVYGGGTAWSDWDSPWFLHYVDPNYNWAGWVRSSPADDPRQLIVNMQLIPSGVASQDWRAEGAAGAFEGYDRTLAQNLVNGGLASAIIVLGAEANGTWEDDNIGSDPAQVAEWVQTWRNTVLAMRSVPGADFRFVWAVNNRVPATPFASYYPGDDVVDVIGDDAYDSGVTADANDWNEVAGGPAGVDALVAFAQSHGKPVAFPEWGVGVRNSGNLAGNDDPGYLNGLAGVVAHADVAFQCYFFNDEWETELQQGPLSLAAYRAAFGDGGWAVGADDGENVTPTPTFAPAPSPPAPAPAPAPATPAAPTASPASPGSAAAPISTATTPGRGTTTAPGAGGGAAGAGAAGSAGRPTSAGATPGHAVHRRRDTRRNATRRSRRAAARVRRLSRLRRRAHSGRRRPHRSR